MALARRIGLTLAALVAFSSFIDFPAFAQTPSPFASWQNDEGTILRGIGGPIPDWDIVAGGGVAVIPDYEGSNEYSIVPAPVIDIRYKDIAFLSTGEGLGVNLLHGQNYRAGIALGYDVGHSEHAARFINGTGGIPPSVEPRVFAEWFWLPFIVSADIRRVIGGTNGMAGDLGIYMSVIGTENFVVFAGPSVTAADNHYMQNSFGVGTTQANPNSRFAPYRAEGGLANANFGISTLYHFTEQLMLSTDIGYERLVGDAAGSPLVQSRNQLGASMTLDYEF